MKSKTVIIFSIWYAGNYGSALTNFSLGKVVEDLGYKCMYAEIPDSLWPDSRLHRDPSFTTRRFGNKYYEIITNSKTTEEQKALNDIADTFLVGSDQIWNYHLCKSSKTYFYLDFAEESVRKISYGTSFGKNKFTGDRNSEKLVKEYLKKFDAISVRESWGVELCKNKFDVKATHVLDPVFLCDKKYYMECIENSKLNHFPQNKYLLAYILDPTESKQSALEFIAEQKNLNLICLAMAHCKKEMKDNWRLPYLENIDVEDWLYYFKNAEMIITDSFHGMCFAIIFKKQFVAISNKRRGADRFTDLLNTLNLEDRLILEPNIIIENFSLFDQKIDYASVDQILDSKKEECIQWLSDALNADKNEMKSKHTILKDNSEKESLLNKLLSNTMEALQILNKENNECYQKIIQLSSKLEEQQHMNRRLISKVNNLESKVQLLMSSYDNQITALEDAIAEQKVELCNLLDKYMELNEKGKKRLRSRFTNSSKKLLSYKGQQENEAD